VASIGVGSTWRRDRDQLVKIVGPNRGNKPIAAIEAPDLLAVLRKLEKRGISDTARNHAQRLAERRQMMQEWADYLDGLKANR
jgi:hypothetical protein